MGHATGMQIIHADQQRIQYNGGMFFWKYSNVFQIIKQITAGINIRDDIKLCVVFSNIFVVVVVERQKKKQQQKGEKGVRTQRDISQLKKDTVAHSKIKITHSFI